MRTLPRRSLLPLLCVCAVCAGPAVVRADAGPSPRALKPPTNRAARPSPSPGCPITGDLVEVYPAKKAHGALEVGARLTITGLPGSHAASVSWVGRLNRDRHPDLLVGLPDCGAWGECIKIVLVGCAAAHRYVVASPPATYVFRWHPGPRRHGGWRTLVETERGGDAMVDDVSEVTWRFSGGRYRKGTVHRLVRVMRAWGEWSDVPSAPVRRTPPRSFRQLCRHARCVGHAGSPVRAFIRTGSTRVGIAWRQGHTLHVVEEQTDPPAAQRVRPVHIVMPTARVHRHPSGMTAVVQVAEKIGGRAREVRFECHGAGVAPRCTIQRRFDAGR